MNIFQSLEEPMSITLAGVSRARMGFDRLLSIADGKSPELSAGGNRRSRDIFGDEIPRMQITDGVAKIPVKGVIVRDWPTIAECFGFCDMAFVAEDIQTALSRGVHTLAFDVDSPGGFSVAPYDAHDMIVDARKTGTRTMAYSQGLLCSAAYDLVAGVHAVYITQGAEAGSIGTILSLTDDSEWMKQRGLKDVIFASGKYKAAGGEFPLPPDHRDYFQKRVMAIAEKFKSNVRAGRKMIQEEAMQGQSFIGQDAVAAGVASAIVKNFEDSLARFSRLK